LNTLSPIP